MRGDAEEGDSEGFTLVSPLALCDLYDLLAALPEHRCGSFVRNAAMPLLTSLRVRAQAA